jgi:hypothetical protein
VTAVLCIAYLGVVFGGRWWRHRQAEEAKAKSFSRLPAELSGSDLKIMHFYATPPAVAPGAKALLCYGVLNASSVRFDPPVEEIKPALSRCIEVFPKKTTTYKLIAETGSKKAEAELTLVVH